MSTARFLFINGVHSPSPNTPPISTFLETHSGAYTTNRTHNNGEILLFYDRHLKRLSKSLKILLDSNPHLFFGPGFCGSMYFSSGLDWESLVRHRVDEVMKVAVPLAVNERSFGEELAISTLIGGDCGGLEGGVEEDVIDRVLDVYVHIGMYVPPVFGGGGNGARLAVVGCRRDCAEAKYSDWAR